MGVLVKGGAAGEVRLVNGVRARVARNFWERARGLIGVKELPPGEGLLIPKCNAIHTFFMRLTIDATFLDKAGRVVKVVRNIPPGRFLVWGGWRAASVLETAAACGAQAGKL